MSFRATEEQIKKVFNGDNKYSIPRNQRNYVWDESNWKDLAEDIEYVFKNKSLDTPNHFIGSFVFQKLEDDSFSIIDGQQRITTLLVILSAIAYLQRKNNDQEEFGITRQYLIGNIGLKTQYFRLENHELTNFETILSYILMKENPDDYQDPKTIIFAGTKKHDKLLKECFLYFLSFFEKYNSSDTEILKIFRSIIISMKVVQIISENELDCYTVFEILNARGLSLASNELIKNYIYKYAQPKYNIDEAKNKWSVILNNAGENIEQFLENYLTAKYVKKGKFDAFQIVKENLPKDSDSICKFLDEMIIASKYFRFFIEPSSCPIIEVSKSLEFFNLVGHRQFRPIFISLFLIFEEEKISEENLSKAFVFLKNFYFGFGTICKNKSNIIEDKVYSLANQIYSDRKFDENSFREALLKYYPNKDTFSKSFIEKGFSNKNRRYKSSNCRKEMRYILSTFEDYFQKDIGEELKCDISKCNIEHIISDSEFTDINCKIGNLLLIAIPKNSKCGDDSFEEKKKIYKTSNLENVKRFLKNYGTQNEWTNELINERAGNLASLAFDKIWSC